MAESSSFGRNETVLLIFEEEEVQWGIGETHGRVEAAQAGCDLGGEARDTCSLIDSRETGFFDHHR